MVSKKRSAILLMSSFFSNIKKLKSSILMILIITTIYAVALLLTFLVQGSVIIQILLLVLNFVLSFLYWRVKGAVIALNIGTVIFIVGAYSKMSLEYLVAGISLLFCLMIMLVIVFRKIESQKKVMQQNEIKYRELFERFKRYFDLVQVMIVGLDVDGNIILANKKACDVLGYEYDELMGRNWFKDFVPNGIRNGLSEYFDQVKKLPNGAFDYHENPVRSKNGTERIIAWQNTIIKDEFGNVAGSLSAGLDITELRQLQEKLTQQLELSKNLYSIAEKLVLEKLSVRERVNTLSKMCVELLDVSLVWVGYAAPDKNVKIVGSYPQDHPYVKDLIVRWDDSPYAQGAVGRSIKTGEYQIIEDVLNDERFIAWKDKIAPYNLKTVLSFPLISPNGVFGALVLYSDKYGFFSKEKIEQIRIISHLAAAALENAKLFEELEKKLGRIEALHQIDRAISASTDLKVVLSVLLDQVIHQLNVHAADIFLFNEYSMNFEYAAGRGFRTHRLNPKPIKLGKGLIGKIGMNKSPMKISGNICEYCKEFENHPCERNEIFAQEGFVFYAAVPLMAKGRLLGVLEVFNRSDIQENGEWFEFLQVLGQQTAIAIDNAKLFEDLQRKNIELIQAYDATIEGWAYALDLRDRETEGHSERVTEFTLKIAKKMGMKDEELVHVKRGALLHDIGKMGIPDQILLKPGKLTDQEWEIMKKHPVYAYQMLSRIEYLRPALDIPYYHHEKWDGTGYPMGLKGQEIPLSARIFAVVDVYDALTSDRPYRKAWSKEEAIEYIKSQSGKHFDPKVVEVFLSVLGEMTSID